MILKFEPDSGEAIWRMSSKRKHKEDKEEIKLELVNN